MRVLSAASLLALAIVVARSQVHAAESSTTLARVREAGVLRCGINVEQAEYSTSDDHGNRQAFDADLCQAVGVAVLGKGAQVKMLDFPDDRTSMVALTNGDVDMVATLTNDFTHSVGTHIQFTRPVLWDGVGFLLPANSQLTRARQLTGKKICFIAETTVEESVRAWFAREHLSFVPFPFQEEGEMQAAFATGNCGAVAGDQTRLAQLRTALAQHQQHSRLLADRISKDPLAAAYLDNDPQWAAIVNWVMEALVQAEESGVTRANANQKHALATSPQGVDPTLRFLLGGSHEIGARLQLEDDWAVKVIEATGNYGEIYERDLGAASSMKLPRAENSLRSSGGLMMALPPK
jgi:general L-amino acid transport system substrate-binding protein